MKKARKNKMFIAIGVFLIILGAVMVWFHIPYSPVKSAFSKDIKELVTSNKLQIENEIFTEEDSAHLPVTIQKYIHNCGYIGTPKMSYMKIEFKDVDFKQGKNGPALTIDYTQYNFAYEPSRMALIDSSMFGIPFEGCDYYQNGIGGMKGVIAKSITFEDASRLEL